MIPQKKLKSRSLEMRFPALWALKNHAVFVAFKISVVVVAFELILLFLIIIFIFINEIQTDGDKRFYRQQLTSFY